MKHISEEGADPLARGGDRSEEALDAAFAAANAGMVAAIRRGLDLDAGLAQIIGAPPRPEAHSPGPSAENGWRLLPFRPLPLRPLPNDGWLRRQDPYICAVDVSTQIARLRFRILELVRQGQIRESATVLLTVAASNLQDLHRGLEGRALSRQAAGNLLDAAGLALETASDAEAAEMACPGRRAPGENPDHLIRDPSAGTCRLSQKSASRAARAALVVPGAALLSALVLALSLLSAGWLHGVLAALEVKKYDPADGVVIAVNAAILGLLLFSVPRRLFRLFRRRSERIVAVTEAIEARAAARRRASDAGKAAAVLRRNLRRRDPERSEALTYMTLLQAVAKLQRPPAEAATSRIDVLREELDSVRPSVIRLFEAAGDCSPCTPR